MAVMINDIPSAIGVKIEAIIQYLVGAGVVKDAKSRRDKYHSTVYGPESFNGGRDAMEIASDGVFSRKNKIEVDVRGNSASWFMDKVLYELDCDISAPWNYDGFSAEDAINFHRDSLRRLPGLGFGMLHKRHIHTYSELIGYQLLDMGH
jgi:hypothetical protein